MTGRPSEFTAKIANAICDALAEGKSLREVCEAKGMPSRNTVRRWLSQYETFRAQYAHAREEQADFYADEIIEIADKAGDAQLARLQVDARKWKAAKLAPKKYGDAVQMKHTDADGGPVQQVIRWALTDTEATPDPSRS